MFFYRLPIWAGPHFCLSVLEEIHLISLCRKMTLSRWNERWREEGLWKRWSSYLVNSGLVDNLRLACDLHSQTNWKSDTRTHIYEWVSVLTHTPTIIHNHTQMIALIRHSRKQYRHSFGETMMLWMWNCFQLIWSEYLWYIYNIYYSGKAGQEERKDKEWEEKGEEKRKERKPRGGNEKRRENNRMKRAGEETWSRGA